MTRSFEDVVLIGGSGRSGTTIAGKLIARHSQAVISRPIEIKFLTGGTGLLDLYQNPFLSRAGRLNLLPQGNLQKFKSSVDTKWWERTAKDGGQSGLFKGIDRKHWDALVEKLSDELRTNRLVACQNFMRSYIDVLKDGADSAIWIDTTPTNLVRKSEISTLLPGCRFIHMVRDGRDVASSIVQENWGPNTHFKGLKWWRTRVKKIVEQCPPGAGDVMHVWLEDLVEDKRTETFKSLLKFLGLPSEVAITDYFERVVIASRLHRGRWHGEVESQADFEKLYLSSLEELFSLGLQRPTRIT